MWTSILAALRTKETALQGFAKIMREGSMPPMSRTWHISPLEAQSKPAPSAARRRRTYGSGLHLTAVTWIRGKVTWKWEADRKRAEFREDSCSSVDAVCRPD